MSTDLNAFLISVIRDLRTFLETPERTGRFLFYHLRYVVSDGRSRR